MVTGWAWNDMVGLLRRTSGVVDGPPYVGRGTCISTPMPRNFSAGVHVSMVAGALPDALACPSWCALVPVMRSHAARFATHDPLVAVLDFAWFCRWVVAGPKARLGSYDQCPAGEAGSHVPGTRRQWDEHLSAWFARYAGLRWAAAEPYWGPGASRSSGCRSCRLT